MALGLVVLVGFPVVGVGYVLGGAAVRGVQLCQRWCCGVELDGDDVRGDEGESVEGVELESGMDIGMRVEDGSGSGSEIGRESLDVSGEEGEERIALMGNGNGSGKGEV